MAMNIPGKGTGFDDNQSVWQAADIDAIVQALKGDGVLSGCAVSAQASPNMTVAVASGIIRSSGVGVTVSSGNVTITAADATNPRIDLIVVNNAGTKSCTAGTPAASPAAPAIPANSILLAMVYVPATDTAIASNQITDKRCFVVPSAFQHIRAFIASAATTFNVNSTSYITVVSFAFNIDLDRCPFTDYRILISGNSNAAGQTVTAQLTPGSVPGTPIHSGGDDLVVSNTPNLYDSGWKSRDDGLVTGVHEYMVALKGSNSTVDLSCTYVDVLLRQTAGS